MSLNFSALLHYRGPSDDSLGVIADLEARATSPELCEVVETGRRRGFAFADRAGDPAGWRSFPDWECLLSERPALPCLRAILELPSGFSLMFGADGVWVSHSVRWLFFLAEREWQRALLGATRWLGRSLDASDCIIAHDEHPAILTFRKGASFKDALQMAEDQGDGEVPRISDLYEEKVHIEELPLHWPGEQPTTTWETHGYWRFNLRREAIA